MRSSAKPGPHQRDIFIRAQGLAHIRSRPLSALQLVFTKGHSARQLVLPRSSWSCARQCWPFASFSVPRGAWRSWARPRPFAKGYHEAAGQKHTCRTWNAHLLIDDLSFPNRLTGGGFSLDQRVPGGAPGKAKLEPWPPSPQEPHGFVHVYASHLRSRPRMHYFLPYLKFNFCGLLGVAQASQENILSVT